MKAPLAGHAQALDRRFFASTMTGLARLFSSFPDLVFLISRQYIPNFPLSCSHEPVCSAAGVTQDLMGALSRQCAATAVRSRLPAKAYCNAASRLPTLARTPGKGSRPKRSVINLRIEVVS